MRSGSSSGVGQKFVVLKSVNITFAYSTQRTIMSLISCSDTELEHAY
jgi:hypothetical protein